jgi:hypothetical protein
MKIWMVIVAVLAACKSPTEQRPAVGSAAPPQPADAAVASTTFPACNRKVTFDVLPPGPLKGSGKLDGHDLLVGSLTGAHYNLSTYDVSARKWQPLPGVDLGPREEHTHFSHFLTDRSLMLVTEVKRDHRVVRRFDRARHRWSAPASTPARASDYFEWTIDDTLVLLPYRCLRQPERTLLLRGNRFESVPTTFTLSSHPATQIVAGKLVMWGGPATARPPSKADVDCKLGSTHTTEGVVLDPATAKWTPMASGPPALTDLSGFSAGGYMFIYGRTGARVVLWRYEVGKNAWKEVGELPRAFADRDLFTPNDAAQVGSTVVFNHGGSTPAQVVIDADAGTLRTSHGLPIEPAAFVAVDKTHVLLIPYSPVPATPTAYIEDVETLEWCELPWIDRAPFYQHDKPTFIGVAETVGDKLLVWLDGQAAGYLASFH